MSQDGAQSMATRVRFGVRSIAPPTIRRLGPLASVPARPMNAVRVSGAQKGYKRIQECAISARVSSRMDRLPGAEGEKGSAQDAIQPVGLPEWLWAQH